MSGNQRGIMKSNGTFVFDFKINNEDERKIFADLQNNWDSVKIKREAEEEAERWKTQAVSLGRELDSVYARLAEEEEKNKNLVEKLETARDNELALQRALKYALEKLDHDQNRHGSL